MSGFPTNFYGMFPANAMFHQAQPMNQQIPASMLDSVNSRGRGRGRGRRGRGRGRGRGRRTSSEESDDDFIPQNGATANDIRRSTRLHQSRATYHDESNDEHSGHEEIDPTPYESHGEGPPVELILSKTTDESKSSYLVKWNHSSYIHSSILSESELGNGSHTKPLLKLFDASFDRGGQIVSDSAPNLLDSIELPVNLFNFYVDRIVDYRPLGSETEDTSPETVDTSHYIPGTITEKLPPLDDFTIFENPFHSEENYQEKEMRNDCVCQLKVEKEEESMSETEASKQIDSKPPENIEFLIKWQGGSESQSTWENPSRLHTTKDEIFTIANVDQTQKLIDLFWSKKLPHKRLPEIPISDRESIEFQGRLATLSESQRNCIHKLLETKRKKDDLIILGESGSGRIASVVCFLDILKSKFHCRHPAIILVDALFAWIWVQAIQQLTNLYSVEYNGNVSNRLVVRNHELVGNKEAHFDVLITDLEIFNKDVDVLGRFEWGSLVVDSIHGEIDYSSIFATNIGHKIYICNENNSQYSSIPSPHSIITMPKYPISYTEQLIFVSNTISLTMHFRLLDLFKSKPTRQKATRDSLLILVELIRAATHPFLCSEYQKTIVSDYKSKLGITQDWNLQNIEYMTLLSNASSKIHKLFEILDRNSIVAVVSDHLSALRIIKQICEMHHIACGMLESPIESERLNLNEPFDNGIVLMNRNFSSPLLDRLNISKVYFIDLSRSYDSDIHLIQFLRRSRPIQVLRFLIWDSFELSLFNRSVQDPHFNFENLSNLQSEHILKIAAFTTQPAREPRTPVEPRQFRYPLDVQNIAAIDESIDEEKEISRDTSFWDTVFANTRKSHVKQSMWKPKDASRFLESFVKHGIGEWDALSNEMGRSQEEVMAFGRAVVLYLLTHIEYDLSQYSLLNSILWFEMYPNEFEHQFDDSGDFWQRIAYDNPTLQANVFIAKPFSKQLLTNKESYIAQLERNWIIRTYLKIREPPYLPIRFLSSREDVTRQPAYFYDFLNKVLEYGPDQVQLKLTNYQTSIEDTRVKFDEIYNSIYSDVLSYLLHKLDTPEINDLRKDQHIKPIIQMIQKGPFLSLWDQHETERIIQTLSDYAIPIDKTGQYDWYEFQSLTRITTKSTSQIRDYTELMLRNTMSSPKDSNIVLDARTVIPADQTNLGRKITIYGLNANRLRDIMLFLKEVRPLLQEGIKVARPSSSLPEKWDLSCDRALLSGICQYGLSNVNKIGHVLITPPQQQHFDFIIETDLHPFISYLEQGDNAIQRMRLLIVCNRNIKRHISFYSDVQQIKMTMTESQRQAIQCATPKVDPERSRAAGSLPAGFQPSSFFPAMQHPPMPPAMMNNINNRRAKEQKPKTGPQAIPQKPIQNIGPLESLFDRAQQQHSELMKPPTYNAIPNNEMFRPTSKSTQPTTKGLFGREANNLPSTLSSKPSTTTTTSIFGPSSSSGVLDLSELPKEFPKHPAPANESNQSSIFDSPASTSTQPTTKGLFGRETNNLPPTLSSIPSSTTTSIFGNSSSSGPLDLSELPKEFPKHPAPTNESNQSSIFDSPSIFDAANNSSSSYFDQGTSNSTNSFEPKKDTIFNLADLPGLPPVFPGSEKAQNNANPPPSTNFYRNENDNESLFSQSSSSSIFGNTAGLPEQLMQHSIHSQSSNQQSLFNNNYSSMQSSYNQSTSFNQSTSLQSNLIQNNSYNCTNSFNQPNSLPSNSFNQTSSLQSMPSNSLPSNSFNQTSSLQSMPSNSLPQNLIPGNSYNQTNSTAFNQLNSYNQANAYNQSTSYNPMSISQTTYNQQNAYNSNYNQSVQQQRKPRQSQNAIPASQSSSLSNLVGSGPQQFSNQFSYNQQYRMGYDTVTSPNGIQSLQAIGSTQGLQPQTSGSFFVPPQPYGGYYNDNNAKSTDLSSLPVMNPNLMIMQDDHMNLMSSAEMEKKKKARKAKNKLKEDNDLFLEDDINKPKKKKLIVKEKKSLTFVYPILPHKLKFSV